MTRSIRNAFATAFLASAAVLLAGCPSTPGAIPGMSDLTGGTTGQTPATTTPTAAQCDRDKPASPAEGGKAELGAYANKLIPNGWNAAYKTEAEVTARFKQAETSATEKANWPCYLKFYPDATAIYLTKKDAPAADAAATPAAETEKK